MLTSHPFAALPSQSAKALKHAAIVHCPAVQAPMAFGNAHTLPHAPQLAVSVERFTHAPPQFVVPVGHVATHVLLTHAWPAAHAWPHAPQLTVSVERFTHAPPQFVVPVGHVVTHVLLTHARPAKHAWPHAPQLAVSDVRFAQTPPPQSVWPVEHVVTQV